MKISALKPADASTRVFQYGIRVNNESRELINQQFFLAHQTYNDIVAEIRRIAQDALLWLQEQAGPEAATIRAKIDELNEQFDKAKAEDNRDALKIIAEERRGLWREWYQLMHAARRENSAELMLKLNNIGERAECSIYLIRCGAVKRGLGWATANAALKAAIQAFRKQWPKFKQPNFRRIAEIPRKTLELQFTTPGGITVESVLSRKCPEVSIHQNGKKYADFTFRVGAGDDRKDVTGTIFYHRALPPEGKIKYARLVEQRIGKDLRHYLQLVVTGMPSNGNGADPTERPLAALDFGWYFEDDGRRIAGFADGGSPDDAEIVRLPSDIDDLLVRSENFKAERDTARDEVVSYLKELAFEAIPEAIQEELLLLRKLPVQHVAPSRLARLSIRWRTECPNYRQSVLQRLEDWRKDDKMRLQAESHLASRARGRRKKYYEELALIWTNKYGTIVIDSPELSEAAVVKDKTTGRHNKLGGIARGGRVKAALYDLEQALVNAASKTGTRLVKIKGRTSKTCSLCGGTIALQNDSDRNALCTECGATLDREKNAAAVVWLQGMAQADAIAQEYRAAQDKHAEQLQKRLERKQARTQARWKARTPSKQK